MQTPAQASTRFPRACQAISKLVVAVALVSVVGVGFSSPTDVRYVHWFSCPSDRPYVHTDAFGNLYCSKYP
jgi:hypothetical protein